MAVHLEVPSVLAADPAPANLGSVTAIVTDQTGATASTTIQLKVDHVPPTWSANPIVLPSGITGVAYSQSLMSYVVDPHANDVLTFSMTGPAWAKLDATNATLSGTPASSDMGLNSWQVTLTDLYGASATTTVQITVTHTAPSWTQNPIVLPDATMQLPIQRQSEVTQRLVILAIPLLSQSVRMLRNGLRWHLTEPLRQIPLLAP